MFVERDELWLTIQEESRRQHEIEVYVASVARTDPGRLMDMKLSELLNLPRRPREQQSAYMCQFAKAMQAQLDRHGDRRLSNAQEIAHDFAASTLGRIRTIGEGDHNPEFEVLRRLGVTADLLSPDMTVGEIGELAVYARKLKIIGDSLIPPAQLTIKDIAPDKLPSIYLESKLASIQQRADRVSGSDLGDAYIAPLTLYADVVEVDRRTCEFLKQVERAHPDIATLMNRFARFADYAEAPTLFES